MTCRTTILTSTAVAVAFAFASPAHAAMPVAGQPTVASDVIQTQAPPDAAPKAKKKSAKSSRQKEVDRSVESGTVPKRYRSSVPKEYHHLIPFGK